MSMRSQSAFMIPKHQQLQTASMVIILQQEQATLSPLPPAPHTPALPRALSGFWCHIMMKNALLLVFKEDVCYPTPPRYQWYFVTFRYRNNAQKQICQLSHHARWTHFSLLEPPGLVGRQRCRNKLWLTRRMAGLGLPWALGPFVSVNLPKVSQSLFCFGLVFAVVEGVAVPAQGFSQ